MSYQDKYLKYKNKYLELKNKIDSYPNMNIIEQIAGAKKSRKKKSNTGGSSKNESEVIFLLGGPGSGKGTLGEKITKEYGYVLISAGDLLREEKSNPKSKYGDLIKEYQAEGKIVPSEITIGLIKNKIFELSSQGIYKILLDGFPRNQENLDLWNKIVGDSIKLKFVIYLKLSEKTMVERVLKRGETSGRSDDNKETVIKRIKVFNEQSLPVIKYYKKEKLVREIDASKSPDEVLDSVKKFFKGGANNSNNSNLKSNKYIIGVAGASGCGKTYFSNFLQEKLIENGISVELLSCDNYYKNYSEKKNSNGTWITPVENNEPNYNWDVPAALDLKLLKDHLEQFHNNVNIEIPDYSFKECHRMEKPSKTIKSSNVQVLIVEGLFVLYDEDLVSQLNLKVFIESNSESCLARRIFRDFVEGRAIDVNASIDKKNKAFINFMNVYKRNIYPAYIQYIEPTKKNSDLIINSEIDYSNTDTKTINFILKEVKESI